MLINAFQKAEGKDKEMLVKWIATPVTQKNRGQKVAAVTSIYNKLGIDLMAKAKMEEYYEQALQALAEVNVPDDKKEALLSFAAKMMKREK